ncbi:MAG TPA: hypothetical protein VGH90_09470 [Chthoniobacteraceae bacterium]|jgi:hypothetical protein
MDADSITAFLDGDFPTPGALDGNAGYALPDASLALLADIVSRLGIRRVFEFGSGRSTGLFLGLGCAVTAIEDSREWLEQTLAKIDATKRESLRAHVLPLQRVWVGGAPMQSWVLPTEALRALKEADLVLVDSPALPPFREHALTLALEHARQALIVVDDAAIPTVARFCRRLAQYNDAPFRELALDHGLFLCGPAKRAPIRLGRSLLETIKAWRRYLRPRAGA